MNKNGTDKTEQPPEIEASAVDGFVMPEYIHRLDTEKPGIFVARLNCYVPSEGYTQMGKMLEAAIDKFAPGSKVVILGPEFEPAIMPDEETMKRLGWVRITRA